MVVPGSPVAAAVAVAAVAVAVAVAAVAVAVAVAAVASREIFVTTAEVMLMIIMAILLRKWHDWPFSEAQLVPSHHPTGCGWEQTLPWAYCLEPLSWAYCLGQYLGLPTVVLSEAAAARER